MTRSPGSWRGIIYGGDGGGGGGSTRLGSMPGRLQRVLVTLIADEGANAEVDATVFVAPAWTGPVVLGYRGFLERLRFGLDPGKEEHDQWLAFGVAGSDV